MAKSYKRLKLAVLVFVGQDVLTTSNKPQYLGDYDWGVQDDFV